MPRPFLLALLVVLIVTVSAPVKAQPEPQLPSDLLFGAASESDLSSQFDTLVRIDAQSLQPVPFYSEKKTHITALNWSLQGQRLAILRNRHQKVAEICVIDRSGQLQTCFKDSISQYALQDIAPNYTVTWSDDEQRAYFVAEHKKILSLVEGDVLTGKTLRTIYELPQAYVEVPPHVHWTPALDRLAIYYGRYPYLSDYKDFIEIRRVTLVDLQTGTQFDLNTYSPEVGYLSFCEGFSPLGNYLAARVYMDEYLPDYSAANPELLALVIVDKSGQVVYTIDRDQLSSYDLHWGHCPAWQAQEEAFYFLAGTWNNDPAMNDRRSIFKYSLSSHELTELKQFGPETGPGYPADPLIPSSDGTAIAFHFEDPTLMSEIAVLLPNGEIIRFNESYSRSTQPRWMPPLDE
jgi:hypothetical protein